MIVLTILATTDLHTNLRAYDYYKDTPVDHYGLSKIATIVAEERKRNPQALLVDAGDFFQGTPLGDVYGKETAKFTDQNPHPAVDAFQVLKYDAVAIGNHEFDYGLEKLRAAIGTGRPRFTSANVQVKNPHSAQFSSLVGLTPPQILTWNRSKLEGLVKVEDPLAAATRTAKNLKEDGCDVVVALVHGGINPLPYTQNEENPAWHVAGVPDVDVVVAGHAHQEFPSEKFAGLKDANLLPWPGSGALSWALSPCKSKKPRAACVFLTENRCLGPPKESPKSPNL
jgi:2',3'-cyclic-nucleotide 2'-phosphodiesterase / 3'-nucleotidase